MTTGREVAKRGAGGKTLAPAIVAAIGRPSLVLLEQHRGELDLAWEYDDYDDDGKLVHRRWPPGRVDEYTKLVPENECRAVIAELDAALAPATYDQAKALARTVMGRYAKRDLYDIDIFLFELTRAFGEAPADLGREASDRLRAKVFLANVGDVKAVLDPLVAEREGARFQAKRHLAEHERRRIEAAKPKADVVTPEQVAAIHEKYGHTKMAADARAEKERRREPSLSQLAMRKRTNEAAMETFRRTHPGVLPEEQAVETG